MWLLVGAPRSGVACVTTHGGLSWETNGKLVGTGGVPKCREAASPAAISQMHPSITEATENHSEEKGCPQIKMPRK